jgi:hypothetical protein
MPAATVGAAYAEQKHLDRTRKVYDERKYGSYQTNQLVEVLKNFSGLENRVLQAKSINK